jgi:hypothetical protein
VADVIALGASVAYCATSGGTYTSLNALKFDIGESKRKVVERKAIGDGGTPGATYPGRVEPQKIKATIPLDSSTYSALQTLCSGGTFRYFKVSWPDGTYEYWYGFIERMGDVKWEDDPSKTVELDVDIQATGGSTYHAA